MESVAHRPRPPLTGRRGTSAPIPGVVVLLVVGGFSAWRGRPVAALVSAGAAVALLQVGALAPAVTGRVTAPLERFGHSLGAVLSVAVLWLTWLVVIVPVAVLNRILRIDLLERGGLSGWHAVERSDRPRRLYQHEPRPAGPLGRRLVRLAAVLLPLVLITLAVVERSTSTRPAPVTPFGERSPAEAATEAGLVVFDDVWVTYRDVPVSRRLFPGEPWAAEVLTVQEDAAPCDAVHVENAENPAFDLATEHVNVVDGRRRTLAVDDPQATLWMFGGSTTYGIGQRDDHTIASELVRLARADGLRLAVVNLGCPGKVNWAETEHFERLLDRGVPPPDVALFLDGINEWNNAFSREVFGLLDPEIPFVGYGSEEERDALAETARDRGYVARHDPRRQMRLAAAQYRRGVEWGRRLGAQHGVAVVHVWQPALFTMPLTAPGNATVFHHDEVDPGSALERGRYYRRAADLSGVDPVDLTDLLDDAIRPLYFDCCHTNEAGARLHAEALYPFVVDALAP